MTPHVRAFIQARMSSRRFPGKVLTPFRGEPLIAHVIRAAAAVVGAEMTTVVTSTDRSDDALAAAVDALGASVFRGSLDNVLARFQEAAARLPSEWILRLSADSPLLDTTVLHAVVARADSARWDLVTTIFPRTFPRGRNAEAISRRALLSVDAAAADEEEREHVTPYFYRRAHEFRILNIESAAPELSQESLAVDTKDDLARLERLSNDDLARLTAGPAA